MREPYGRVFRGAIVAIIAAGLGGCATTKAPLARVDAPALATALRSKLDRDARLAKSAVVAVNPATGVVTLSGEVATAEERATAGRLISSVNGVSMVYNELEIRRAPR